MSTLYTKKFMKHEILDKKALCFIIANIQFIMVQTFSHQLILLFTSSNDLHLGQRFEKVNKNTFSPTRL